MTIATLVPSANRRNEDAVKLLETYLQQAKDGEIDCVALVAIDPKGASITACSSTDKLQYLLGGLSMLQFRIMQSMPPERL